MTRPVYESTDDKARQAEALRACASAWKVAIIDQPPLSPFDAMLTRGNGHKGTMVEVKCRTHRSDFYTTFMISARKMMECCNLALARAERFIVLVAFADGLWYVEPLKHMSRLTYTIGGREDRGDTMDLEIVAHIPCALLKRVAV